MQTSTQQPDTLVISHVRTTQLITTVSTPALPQPRSCTGCTGSHTAPATVNNVRSSPVIRL